MTDIRDSLGRIVGQADLLTDAAAMGPFCGDWFGRFRGAAQAVVLPRTTEQVAAVVSACSEAGVPIVPQGGNTSVCGGSVPDGGVARAVVLSLSRMDAILDIDTATNAIVAESGCILANIQAAAEQAGRFFPLSLSAEGSCQIGGTISTNAGGTSVLRYGTMRDLVLGLRVVLPDGRIWDGLRTVRKDSSGYDLKGLWIGAEGTLGIITAAALKIFPLPRERLVAWVAVAGPEMPLRLLAAFRERFDARLVAFELMSRSKLRMVYDHIPDTRPPLDPDYEWQILLEVAETTQTDMLSRELEQALGAALEEGHVVNATIAQSAQQAADFWRLRHAGTEALKAAGFSLTHDIAVPLGAVPDYIRRVDERVAVQYPEAQTTVVCHLGDGNVHYNLTFSRDYWSRLEAPEVFAEGVSELIQDIAMDMNGSFVAEHGIGRKYRHAATRYKSATERDIVYGIKSLLDPKGIMNPGRVLPE